MENRDRWWNLNNPYTYRDDNLRAMGFDSYIVYLRSDLWASIRLRVFERVGGKCERCYRPANQVHHRAYDPATLRGESIHALTATCKRCHHKAEQPKNKRRARWDKLERANKKLYKAHPSGEFR